MRINPALRGIVVAAATMAGVAATTIAAEPMESEVVLSSATLEFAGRVARNYWYLFGDTNRSNLESINRDLRGARQEWDRSRDAQGRSSALVRAADPAARLLRHVKENPNLLRIDLGVSGLRGRLEGAVELPGDTGALLLEVIAGGKGEYFHTQLGNLGLMPGETSVFVFEGIRAGTNYVLLGLENIPSKKTTPGLESGLREKTQFVSRWMW